MKNYFIKDITSQKIGYADPKDPEISKRFLSMSEYINIAKKILKHFGPKLNLSRKQINMMLNSDDYLSELAHQLMLADWRFEEGKGKEIYSYRNQCGIWAIKDMMGLSKTRANQNHQSLDTPVGENQEIIPQEDVEAINPQDIFSNNEIITSIRKKIDFLIKNSQLTEPQKKCIILRYFGGPKGTGIISYSEIGRSFEPPISRQAVKQNIDRGMATLRLMVKGSNL